VLPTPKLFIGHKPRDISVIINRCFNWKQCAMKSREVMHESLMQIPVHSDVCVRVILVTIRETD